LLGLLRYLTPHGKANSFDAHGGSWTVIGSGIRDHGGTELRD